MVRFLALLVWIVLAPTVLAEEERIDASDPTKIYTYMGGGLKYNDYTNGEYMWETRAIGNIGLSDHDMLLFEFGYGWHEGKQSERRNHGFTNSRLRWFHLYDMNYGLETGYRGFGLQGDLQLAGQMKCKYVGSDLHNSLMFKDNITK